MKEPLDRFECVGPTGVPFSEPRETVDRAWARKTIQQLEAELAAAEARAERAEALLREARPMVAFCYKYFENETLPDRIDAVLAQIEKETQK